MNPALSVIFFTTLSGAGYGVLMWLGVWIALDHVRGNPMQRELLLAWLVSLCVASILIAVGLLSSMLHLGKPGRAWRAFSQWRTSWLSREGVMSIVTYVPVAALLASIGMAITPSRSYDLAGIRLLPALATTMALCALVTVICTAMIYASLKTIPSWRHPLVVPGYLVFALLSGGALLAAMSGIAGLTDLGIHAFAAMTGALALLSAAIKLACWRAVDTQPLPATRGDAVGLPDRVVSVFERPHTEDSYITREMAFAVARKHAGRMRAIAVVLFGVTPLAAAAGAWLVPASAGFAFAGGAAAALAGTFVERWLFFAEARHLVTLYY